MKPPLSTADEAYVPRVPRACRADGALHPIRSRSADATVDPMIRLGRRRAFTRLVTIQLDLVRALQAPAGVSYLIYPILSLLSTASLTAIGAETEKLFDTD